MCVYIYMYIDKLLYAYKHIQTTTSKEGCRRRRAGAAGADRRLGE